MPTTLPFGTLAAQFPHKFTCDKNADRPVSAGILRFTKGGLKSSAALPAKKGNNSANLAQTAVKHLRAGLTSQYGAGCGVTAAVPAANSVWTCLDFEFPAQRLEAC